MPENPPTGFEPVPQTQLQPPVQYPEFLPSQPGAMATGLTPAHFAAIAGMNAPPPASSGGGAAMPPGPGAAMDPEAQRAALAKVIAEMNAADPTKRLWMPDDPMLERVMRGPAGGGGNNPGYTTSGRFSGGATSSASSPMGGGLQRGGGLW
jgi:hypothetical protein